MITKAITGAPVEIIEKRVSRIKEALNIKFEDANNPVKYIVDILPDKTEVFFYKPGKEYFRKNPNYNDMNPNVGNLFSKFSFADIWELLCKLRNSISIDNYKKLSVILYRVAYLLDFKYVNGILKFMPDDELLNEINEIQNEVNLKGLNINILAFIHFLDILAWNDEMKTHAYYENYFDRTNFKKGRINTILSCISVPILIQRFVDEILLNKEDTSQIDFSIIVNVAQKFAISRGIHSMSKKELIELLKPYLTD